MDKVGLKRYLPLLFLGLAAAIIPGCKPDYPTARGENNMTTIPAIDQDRPAITERATFSLG